MNVWQFYHTFSICLSVFLFYFALSPFLSHTATVCAVLFCLNNLFLYTAAPN